jgi:DNA phosphorothioation-dependent restriction protein DptH
VNQLVGEIAEFIENRVKSSARTLPDIGGTLRSIFHGPPLHLLDQILARLTTEGGLAVTLGDGTTVQVPVLLPVERLEPGTGNPPVGVSGRCDPSHLLALRNTPSCPRFVALAGPAQHSILSVAQATDDFGLAPGNNSGSATAEDWWADEFIQHLVDGALSRHPLLDVDRDGARQLLKEAVLAAEEGDRHDPQRPNGWAAIARVMSLTDTHVPFLTQWSLACGFPPASGGRIEAKEQVRVLQALMYAIVDEGYTTCAERLKRNATGEEEGAIEACLEHLRRECEVPLALIRAGAFYYAPTRGTSIGSAPDWWGILTSDRLAELLEQEADEQVGTRLKARA